MDTSTALYHRAASARIPSELIDSAIDQAIGCVPGAEARVRIRSLLQDETHAAVLRKEATDVVILVTCALEHPEQEVYQGLIGLVAPEPFDPLTGAFKRSLMSLLAADALEGTANDAREALRCLLDRGIEACGGQASAPQGKIAI